MNLDEWSTLKAGQAIYSVKTGLARKIVSVNKKTLDIKLKSNNSPSRDVVYHSYQRKTFCIKKPEDIISREIKTNNGKVFVKRGFKRDLAERRVHIIDGKPCVIVFHTCYVLKKYIEKSLSLPAYYEIEPLDDDD